MTPTQLGHFIHLFFFFSKWASLVPSYIGCRTCYKTHTRGLGPRMPFPGNWIFLQKIWEIPGPEHSVTSYSRSRLSTGIPDWLFPGLFKGRETFRNSQTLPELKVKKLFLALVESFQTGTDWLMKFSTRRYFSRRVPFLNWAVSSRPVYFPDFSRILSSDETRKH